MVTKFVPWNTWGHIIKLYYAIYEQENGPHPAEKQGTHTHTGV